MSGKLAWGYYPTTGVWLPIRVDSAGRLQVDMSAVNLDDLGDVDLTGLADDDFLYYDQASGLWKPRKLADADIPSTIARDSEVVAAIESHADLPSVHHPRYTDAEALTVIEAALRQIYNGDTLLVDLTDAGILTLPEQPSALIYPSGPYQYIPNSQWTHVLLDTIDHDVQGETDVTVTAGTATATSASHLIDTTLNQFTPADVGRTVWNTTDNTYAIVTAYNSASDLTLSANIMASGEGYKLYFSRYTATVAGRYLIIGSIAYETDNTVDGKKYIAAIYKNGVESGKNRILSPANNQFMQTQVTVKLSLAVGDYVALWTHHDSGVTAKFSYTLSAVSLSIHKIA